MIGYVENVEEYKKYFPICELSKDKLYQQDINKYTKSIVFLHINEEYMDIKIKNAIPLRRRGKSNTVCTGL